MWSQKYSMYIKQNKVKERGDVHTSEELCICARDREEREERDVRSRRKIKALAAFYVMLDN